MLGGLSCFLVLCLDRNCRGVGALVYVWCRDERTAFLASAGKGIRLPHRVENSGGSVETFSAVETDEMLLCFSRFDI